MIVLGLVLLVLGFVFAIHLLWIVGLLLLLCGIVLALFGAAGRSVGGRTWWF